MLARRRRTCQKSGLGTRARGHGDGGSGCMIVIGRPVTGDFEFVCEGSFCAVVCSPKCNLLIEGELGLNCR